jgi:hypothetical protein
MSKTPKTIRISLNDFLDYADCMVYWSINYTDVVVDRATYEAGRAMCAAEINEARDEATGKHKNIRAALAAANIMNTLHGFPQESEAYRAKRIACEQALAARVAARRATNPNESEPVEFLS